MYVCHEQIDSIVKTLNNQKAVNIFVSKKIDTNIDLIKFISDL